MPARSPWEERLRGLRGSGPEPSFKEHHARKQIVFKVTSHIKTKSGVKTIADYISSNGGSSKNIAFDENGITLDGDEIAREIEDWNLIANVENLSKKARDLPASQRHELSTKERYHHVQANHMILSFPVRHDEVADRQLHNIAQEFLRPLAEQGHRAIYAIHRHQNNPHIHILARSQGNHGRLRLAKSQLKTLRKWGASVSRANGLDVYAHKRESRYDVVQAIEAGRAPLRNRGKKWRQDQKQKTKQTGRSLLERQVPTWYARNGLDYEARRSGSAPQKVKSQSVVLPSLPDRTSHAIDQRFTHAFKEAPAARQAFLEMLAENHKTALWYINHQPHVFGQTTQEKAKVSLTDRHLKIPEQWRIDTQRRIAEAQHTIAPNELNKVLAFAGMFRDQTSKRRAKKQRAFEQERLNRALQSKGMTPPLSVSATPTATPEKSRADFVKFMRDAIQKLKTPTPKTPMPERSSLEHPKTETAKAPRSDAQVQDQTDRIYKDIQKAKGLGRGGPTRGRVRGRDK